jgi:hypothetical protein
MTLTDLAPAELGEFEGYAATFGNIDRGGDLIERGAFASVTAAINAGRVVVPIVAGREGGGHGLGDPRDVVGVVLKALEDHTGWKISARFAGDADSQALRRKVLSGGLSMSIGYGVPPGGARPMRLADGRQGRVLAVIDPVAHVALTAMPMNPDARITSAKASPGAWPVPVTAAAIVTTSQQIAQEHRRRHPDRFAEMADRLLDAGAWPGPETGFDLTTRRRLAMKAVDLKVTRQQQASRQAPELTLRQQREQRIRQLDDARFYAELAESRATGS